MKRRIESDPVEGAIPPKASSLGKLLDREIDTWTGLMMRGSARRMGLHKKMIARVEKSLIRAVLERTNGNQVESAAILGINRNTLARKIRDHGLLSVARRRRTRKKKT